MSEIAIEQSPNWDVDLLHGQHQRYLHGVPVWGGNGGGMYTATLYLDTDILRVAEGSHLTRIPLDREDCAVPGEGASIKAHTVFAGDIVVRDVGCCHAGAEQASADTRIRVSTAFGGAGRALTKAMEIGNFARLLEMKAEPAQPVKQKKSGAP
jgi:hypothetical protein